MTSRSLSLTTVLATGSMLMWGVAAHAADEQPAVISPLEDTAQAASPDQALAEPAPLSEGIEAASPDVSVVEAGDPVEADSKSLDELALDDETGLDLDALTAEPTADTDSDAAEATQPSAQAEPATPSSETSSVWQSQPVPAAPSESAPTSDSVVSQTEDVASPTEGLEPAVQTASGEGVELEIATRRTPTTVSKGIPLGPIGYDAAGHKGRVHTVASGNTLWAIADSYLGTPWVWPSIWNENERIENPHLIVPGDLLWITSSEMRRVTPQEAQELITGEASQPVEVAATDLDADDLADPIGEFDGVEIQDGPAEIPQTVEIAMPQALNQVPVSVPSAKGYASETGRTITVASRESMSFVTSETLEAASSVVGSQSERVWLADGDRLFVGLGEGEVDKGAQFTVFRDAEEVRDVDGSLLGYHVEILGWLEVDEVHTETALATVRHSVAEIEKGDRLVPRIKVASTVPIRQAPDGIEGHIVYMPNHRTVMGTVDYVYVNLGSIHGMEVGSALEVFTEGVVRPDEVRRTDVQTPDRPVADLVVVAVKPASAVAFVAHTNTELEIGDVVRTGTDRIASRRR